MIEQPAPGAPATLVSIASYLPPNFENVTTVMEVLKRYPTRGSE
jgi:hypothetical protein